MTQAPGFALSRTARSRFGVDGVPATDRGHLKVLDRSGVRRLAARMNETREPGSPPAQAGEIVAMGLLHEIFHLLVERYEEDVNRRLLTKPGITGLWQVSGRSNLSWDESVKIDLYYVENWSITGDLVILLKTVRAVVGSAGAY